MPDPALIGRDALRVRLDARPEAVLALVGPPGVGKSALAAAWVAELGDAGVAWVDLSGVDDPADVPDALARARGLPPPAPGAPEARLAALCPPDEPLVVLLDGADGVARALGGMLPAGPRWRLTCRVAPPGMPVLRVPPLDAAHAAALWRRLTPSPDPAHDPRIVALTDGLPLALQLAARRRSLLPAGALADRLERSIAVLGAGSSLRAALEASIEGLRPEDRAALDRLRVAPGPVPLAAAERLLADLGDPLDRLAALQDASLLDDRAPPGAVGVLRVAASARTDVPVPDAAVATWRSWCDETAAAWAAGHRPDHPDVAARALQRRAAEGDAPAVTRVDLALALRGRVRPDQLGDMVRPLPLEAVPPERRVDLLRAQVTADEITGRPDAASARLQAAGPVGEDARLQGSWTYMLDRQGRTDAAIARLGDAIARTDDPETAAVLRAYRGNLLWWCRGDHAAAEADLRAGLAVAPTGGRGAISLRLLEASLLLDRGQLDLGRARLDATLAAAAEAGQAYLRVQGLVSGSEYLAYAGALDAALPLARQGLDEALRLGSPATEAAARHSLATVAALRGRSAAALTHIAAGRARLLGTGLKRLEGQLLLELAAVQAARGRVAAARDALDRARGRMLAENRYGEADLAVLVDGLVAVAEARAADDPRPHLARARAALEAPCGASPTRVRFFRGRLRAALDRDAARVRDDTALVVGAEGRWFRVDGDPPVDLRRSRTNTRILAALAAARAPLPLEALVAAGWPGERILEKAARHRVYVAVSTLRKAGLGDLLVRGPDGYALAAPGGVTRRPERDPPA